jgi:DNA polymerase III delta prime subunit
MSKFDSLWVEKYRPATLDDIILSELNEVIVRKFEKNNEIPNLLFVGPAGIGKTSLAKILTKSVLKSQYLYINASDENGIDTIRTKVTNFSKVKSFDGTIKVIILDEVDGLTLDAQRALRNTMEEYSEFVRFILTANYKHRVISALQSRCQSLDLIPPTKEFIERCNSILECESVKLPENPEKLEKLCKTLYPDLRKVINELQKCTVDGELLIDKIDINRKFIENLYSLLQQGLVLKLRKIVIENETRFSGDYTELLRSLFNYIHDAKIKDSVKTQQLLVAAEHLYRMAFVVDPEINFYSCLVALSNIK